ncbi:beta-lactamase [Rhodococcus sp. AG1013]|nr:beta-lactamase [Rhodococcus sp. AG1013]
MSHRAGLHRVRGLVPGPLGLMDHAAVTAALAASAPDPRSPMLPGYHAVTYGTLVAELLARATGKPFAELVRTEIAEPLGVPEFWFVVPPEQRYRIAKSFPRINPFRLSWDTTSFVLSRIPGLRGVADAGMPRGFDELVRNPAIHDVAMPGWNGVFNARALAKMYGALANGGSVEGIQFLRSETVAQLSEVQTTDRDFVLGIRTNWRLGYHAALVASRTQYEHAFGHYGLGGSGAFADSKSGLALAFVTNRMGNALTPLTDLRMLRLGAQAQSIARRL